MNELDDVVALETFDQFLLLKSDDFACAVGRVDDTLPNDKAHLTLSIIFVSTVAHFGSTLRRPGLRRGCEATSIQPVTSTIAVPEGKCYWK